MVRPVFAPFYPSMDPIPVKKSTYMAAETPDNPSASSEAKTWDDLAVMLGRNSSSIHRLRHNPDAPTTRDIAAWRAYMAEREATRAPTSSGAVTAAPDELPGECEYDKPVAAGKTTYAKAIQREKAIAERIMNETRRLENAKARGLLVTREEAEKAAALVRDRLEARYDRAIARALGELAAEQPAAMPPELRAKILAAVNAALDAD